MSSTMTLTPRPLAVPAAALATALTLALAAGCGGGGAGPESRPDPAAAGAPEAAGQGFETAAEAAPVNATPEAALEPPAPAPSAIEPRSEWRIDEAIPTPEEVAEYELLAKFVRGDGRLVVVYRRPDGTVWRRVQGRLGSFTMVEEGQIEP